MTLMCDVTSINKTAAFLKVSSDKVRRIKTLSFGRR